MEVKKALDAGYRETLKLYREASRKRREQAKKLKANGMTNAAIGRALGVSRQRAQQMVDGE